MLSNTHTINTVAELIKLSVAPVFFLAGIAGLLNVLTGRLARIVDKLDTIDINIEKQPSHEKKNFLKAKFLERRKFLIKRMKNINSSIFLCATTGLLIALVIVTMFLSSLLNFEDSLFIAMLFILAMITFICALILFLREIHFTTSFIKSKA